jgi:competence protein ComEC
MSRALRLRLGTLATFCVVGIATWAMPFFVTGSALQPNLTVTFLNIGQGDSILIETPDGVQALVDGGPDAAVLGELAAALPLFDRSLDLVLGTHPDKDHIGGLVDVLHRYKVSTIITTENTGETLTAFNYRKALTQEGADVVMARAGQVYQLGASTTLVIFSPVSDPSMLESNTASIVAQVRYGSTTIMLTGDAPSSIERYLVDAYGTQLQSDVLKLGHHGSKTSSSDEFLSAVNPKFAAVSAGKNNTYGHPALETVARVNAHNIPIVSTIEQGRITFASDGVSIWQIR